MKGLMRCRGKAVGSGKVGWFTTKDRSGNDLIEKGKIYICTATAAITDGFDIKDCKVERPPGHPHSRSLYK